MASSSGIRNTLPSDDATPDFSTQESIVRALSSKLGRNFDQFDKLMKQCKNGQKIISRQFGCTQADPPVSWELLVYPNGKREENNGNVSFFLRKAGLQCGEAPIIAEFEIYALHENGQRVMFCYGRKDFTQVPGCGKLQVSRDSMSDALRADGSLHLICAVDYFPPGSIECLPRSKIYVEATDDGDICNGDDDEKKAEVSMRDSLKKLLDSEILADCTIKVANRQIKTHRCILGQHSDVFLSMFENELIDTKDAIIDIADSSYEAVRAMVEYMYSGSCESAEQYSEEVLVLAEKYVVFPLNEQCERFIAQIIWHTNLTSMVILADTYSASILKQACIRFLVAHYKAVIHTDKWEAMKEVRFGLALELLKAVLAKCDESPA